jgi:hypothetical protein
MPNFKKIFEFNTIIRPNMNTIMAGIHCPKPVSESLGPWVNTDAETTALDKKLSEHYKHSDQDIKYADNPKLALARYSHASGHLNSWLWGRHHDSIRTRNQSNKGSTDQLDRAISANKTPHEMMVYSGVKGDPRKKMNSEGIVHHPAYLSTSIKKGVADSFAQDNRDESNEINGKSQYHAHLLHIHLPEGHDSAYINHISEHNHEHEMLLPRGMNLKHNETITDTKETPHASYHTHHHFMSVAPETPKMHTGFHDEQGLPEE